MGAPRSGPGFRTRLRRRASRWGHDRHGVTAVIGSILVLAIVFVAIAGILFWGLPAIRSFQDHSEFKSVLVQLEEVNSDLRVNRLYQGASPNDITLKQGSLDWVQGSRWVVMVHANATFAPVALGGWEPEDVATVSLIGIPVASDIFVDSFQEDDEDAVARVYACSGTCAVGLGTYRLDGEMTRFRIKTGGTLQAEAWVFDAGRLTYRQKSTDDVNRIHLEMGAVFAQQRAALFLEEGPTVKPPDFDADPSDTSYLFRILQLEETTFSVGEGSHKVVSNVKGSWGTAQGRPLVDPSRSVRIQIDDAGATGNAVGLLEEGFCNYFASQDHYVQETNAGDCGGGDVNLLYDPPDVPASNDGEFLYLLSHTLTKVSQPTGGTN